MSDNLREQIFESLNLKNTDELLDIWQTNDREEWSDTAFDLIREILSERGVEIPVQDEFVPGEEKDEAEDDLNLTEWERKIVDDENPPTYYDPFETVRISKWLDLAAKIMVGLIILSNLINYQSTNRIIHSYFASNPIPILEAILTFLLVALNVAIGAASTYFTLITLSRILKILMEMEFNSRIDK
jgi:hypothetical protein